jgi:hypothetical protein
MGFFEGAGGVVFVAAAALPLLFGKAALENILPLGQFKSMAAGGMMILGNVAVTFAVAGSFGHLAIEFMEETRKADADDPATGDEIDREQAR